MRLSRLATWMMCVALAPAVLVGLGCDAKTAPTLAAQQSPEIHLVTVKTGHLHRLVRSNGIVQAVNSLTIRVPRIEDQGGNVTVTMLIASGTEVKPGDVLA